MLRYLDECVCVCVCAWPCVCGEPENNVETKQAAASGSDLYSALN